MALNIIEQQVLAELRLDQTRPFHLTDHLGAVRAALLIAAVLAVWSPARLAGQRRKGVLNQRES